jgi:hypothetical protein
MALSDESGESLEQPLQEQETLRENTNKFEHIKGAREKEEPLHSEISESQRRSSELTLSLVQAVHTRNRRMNDTRQNSNEPCIVPKNCQKLPEITKV